MADQPFDVRKAIEQSSTRSSLSELAKRGIARVKVLDEQMINKLIGESVERIISLRTNLLSPEDRAKIVDASRKELDRLMAEHKTMSDKAELMERDKGTLAANVENLESQLKAQKNLLEQTAKQRYEQGKQEGLAEVEELKKKKPAWEAEIAKRVRAEVEKDLESRAATSRSQTTQVKAVFAKREMELLAEVDVLAKKIEAAQKEAADSKAAAAKREQEIQAEIDGLRKKLETAATQARSVVDDLGKKSSATQQELQAKTDAAAKREQELQAEIDGLKKKLEAASTQARSVADDLGKKTSATQSELQAKAKELDAAVKRGQELQAEIDGLKKSLETASVQARSVADDLGKRASTTQQELQAKAKELDAAAKRAQEIESQAEDLRKKLAAAQKEAAEKVSSHEAAAGQAKSAAARRESELQAEIDGLKEEAETQEAAAAKREHELQAEAEGVRKKSSSLLADMEKVRGEFARREEESKAKVRELEAAAAQSKASLTKREQAFETALEEERRKSAAQEPEIAKRIRREVELEFAGKAGAQQAGLDQAKTDLARREEDLRGQWERREREIREDFSRREQDIVARGALQKEAELRPKIEELHAKNVELVEKQSREMNELFQRTLDSLSKKMDNLKFRTVAGGGMGGVASFGADPEFRPSQAVLENMLKEELDSNLKSMQVEGKSAGKLGSALDRLKALRGGGGGKPDEKKK